MQNRLFEKKKKKKTNKNEKNEQHRDSTLDTDIFFANDYKAMKARAFEYTYLEICTDYSIHTNRKHTVHKQTKQ